MQSYSAVLLPKFGMICNVHGGVVAYSIGVFLGTVAFCSCIVVRGVN